MKPRKRVRDDAQDAGLCQITIPIKTYALLECIAARQKESVQSVLCEMVETTAVMSEAGKIEVVFPHKTGRPVQIVCHLPADEPAMR